MRSLKIALASAFVAAGLLSVGSVVSVTPAEAAAKKAKAGPGKCGAGMYYNMKAKKCMAPAAKT